MSITERRDWQDAGPPFHDDDGLFLSPVHAATHAIVVQGGWTDPRTEANRMLRAGGVLAERAQVWLDENPLPPLRRPETDAGTTPAATDQGVDLGAVRDYLAARDEVDQVDAVLREAKKRRDAAEARVLALYEQHGCASVRVDGRLVSLTKKLYARTKPGEEPALLAALDDAGHADVISHKVNPSTLSALVREHQKEGDPLPEAIMQHVEVTELFGLQQRKG